MNIILLERIRKLGQMGDVVSVKPGYARNYLLPQGKALRATKANKTQFEAQRVQLEAHNLEQKTEAEAVGEKLSGEVFIAIRQAGDAGQLYGSVSTRDIAEAISEGGFSVARHQIVLPLPIKLLGMHNVTVHLHPEVDITIVMNVARSDDEATRQAAGEDMTAIRDDDDDEDDADMMSPEDVFDEDAEHEAGLDDLDAATAQTATTEEDDETDTGEAETEDDPASKMEGNGAA